jgi:general secretion pathway protein A
MYTDFYHLQMNPFSNSPDPRFLYSMPHTLEALAALEFGIMARRGFMVLTGEAGSGKTTLIRKTMEAFDSERVITSYVFNPRLEFMDFMEFVLADFGITNYAKTKAGILLQLNRWLIERFEAGQTCVIFVDEAQGLSKELLEEIRLLTNLETSSQKLLQIVLSGQPELAEKLNAPELRQLRQRIALWARIYTLTEQQTAGYIERRLSYAGISTENDGTHQVFLPEAIREIFKASHGIPRLINLICEHSLIFGYVEQMTQITGQLVQDVLLDLELGPSLVYEHSKSHDGSRASGSSGDDTRPQPPFVSMEFSRKP